jgi:tetratricopeptide (TPR) repeat protein
VTRSAVIASLMLSLAGCKDKEPAETRQAGVVRSVQHRDAVAAKPPPIAPEQRAAYRRHLAAGRELAGDNKWRDAAVEFEAALEAIPMDGRALSELGWASFQAGDFDRARDVNRKSVLASSEAAVKAASLYNLGRVAEATGAKDDAARHFRESLKLRDNKIVRERLAKLGAAPVEDWRIDQTQIPCTEPTTVAKLCSCLEKARAADYPSGTFSCDPDIDEADSHYGVISTSHGHGDVYVQLVGKSGAGWSVAAELEYAYNPGAFGIYEELSDDMLVDSREIGGREVLWIEVIKSRSDSDMGIDEEESVESTKLTVCLADKKAGVRCIFQAPIAERYERDKLGMFEGEDIEHTKGLPIKRAGKLKAELGAGGVLTLTLAEGQKTPWLAPYVGRHKIW